MVDLKSVFFLLLGIGFITNGIIGLLKKHKKLKTTFTSSDEYYGYKGKSAIIVNIIYIVIGSLLFFSTLFSKIIKLLSNK